MEPVEFLKPNTLKFLKLCVANEETEKDESRIEGKALALSFLDAVVPDMRIPGQMEFKGLESPDPFMPVFESNLDIGYAGKNHDDEKLVIVETWTALHALQTLRTACTFLCTLDEDPFSVDDEMLEILKEARIELGVQSNDPLLDEADVTGPLDLPVGECVFSDQYDTCFRCNTIIRIDPDSYSWKADFYHNESCELICGECVRTKPEELEGYFKWLLDNESAANTILEGDDLEKAGFKCLSLDLQRGWHKGQTDDPPAIMAACKEALPEAAFIFDIDGVRQFDTSFSLWVKGVTDEQVEALEDVALCAKKGVEIGEQFKKAVANINFSKSEMMIDHAEKNGITIINVDLERGEATQRNVSAQDFIDGKALKK